MMKNLDFILTLVNKVNGKTYSAIKFVDNQRKKNEYIVITNIHSYKADNVIYIDNIINLINFVKLNHGKNGKKYIIFFDEIFTVLMKRTVC